MCLVTTRPAPPTAPDGDSTLHPHGSGTPRCWSFVAGLFPLAQHPPGAFRLSPPVGFPCLKAGECSVLRLDHSLRVRPSVRGHSGGSHISAVLHDTSVKTGARCLFHILRRSPRDGVAGADGNSVFNLGGASTRLSSVAAPSFKFTPTVCTLSIRNVPTRLQRGYCEHPTGIRCQWKRKDPPRAVPQAPSPRSRRRPRSLKGQPPAHSPPQSRHQ